MTQSISNYIRDAMMSRLQNVTSWKVKRTVPSPMLQPGEQPSLGIYLIREVMNADGDANVGPPRYICDATFSISVIDQATSTSVVEGSIDTWIDTILDTLLCDGTFIDLRDASNKQIIDSIPQIARSYQFPQNGEAYYVEARLQITIRYFCYFEPVAPNALTEVDVDTEPFDGTVQGATYTTSIPLAQ